MRSATDCGKAAGSCGEGKLPQKTRESSSPNRERHQTSSLEPLLLNTRLKYIQMHLLPYTVLPHLSPSSGSRNLPKKSGRNHCTCTSAGGAPQRLSKWARVGAVSRCFQPHSVFHGPDTYLSVAALWVLPENR